MRSSQPTSRAAHSCNCLRSAESVFTKPRAGNGLLDGMPNPATLPAWLTEADVDYYAREFARTGFRGSLNWYRNMDRDWRELPKIGTTGIEQPVSYMGARRDPSVIYAPFDDMIAVAPRLRQIVFLEGCGHWVEEERPDDITLRCDAGRARDGAPGSLLSAPRPSALAPA